MEDLVKGGQGRSAADVANAGIIVGFVFVIGLLFGAAGFLKYVTGLDVRRSSEKPNIIVRPSTAIIRPEIKVSPATVNFPEIPPQPKPEVNLTHIIDPKIYKPMIKREIIEVIGEEYESAKEYYRQLIRANVSKQAPVPTITDLSQDEDQAGRAALAGTEDVAIPPPEVIKSE